MTLPYAINVKELKNRKGHKAIIIKRKRKRKRKLIESENVNENDKK